MAQIKRMAVCSFSEYKFEDGTVIAQGETQPLIAPSFAHYEDSGWDQACMLNVVAFIGNF